MPANLNALIRYKTINSCLYGGRRKWTIDELIDACSDALAESRGRYESVSERTVRDDIRVMRSDILGFNAPLEQNKGLYFYSDPDYSIMSISITDSGLASQIINLLSELKMTVNHPELESILNKLRQLSGWNELAEKSRSRSVKKSYKESASFEPSMPAPAKAQEVESDMIMSNLKFRISSRSEVEWGDVMSFV
jgi:predicted DNA-binding transcriptional regulator YafY